MHTAYENVELKLMNSSILVVRTGIDVSLSLHFATIVHTRANMPTYQKHYVHSC